MDKRCEEIQELLVDMTSSEELTEDLKTHLEDCENCKLYFEALLESSELLSNLDNYEPENELVAETLKKVREHKIEPGWVKKTIAAAISWITKSIKGFYKGYELLAMNPRYASVAGIAFLVLISSFVFLGSITMLGKRAEVDFQEIATTYNDVRLDDSEDYRWSKKSPREKFAMKQDAPKPAFEFREEIPSKYKGKGLSSTRGNRESNIATGHITKDQLAGSSAPVDTKSLYGSDDAIGQYRQHGNKIQAEKDFYSQLSRDQQVLTQTEPQVSIRAGEVQVEKEGFLDLRKKNRRLPSSVTASLEESDKFVLGGGRFAGKEMHADGLVDFGDFDGSEMAVDEEEMPEVVNELSSLDRMDRMMEPLVRGVKPESKKSEIAQDPQKTPLQSLLDNRSLTKNVPFQEAAGYWANTYIPGDPAFNWLHHTIQKQQSEISKRGLANILGIEELVTQNDQPFDAPHAAALNVFLHADRAGVQGETRTLVQVGLKATDRRSGIRPKMNLVLVVNTSSDLSKQEREKIEALVHAFSAIKQSGDQFTLIMAGDNGGAIVEPENFRYGHLMVALKSLSNRESLKKKSRSLIAAMEKAVDKLASETDETSALGSTSVVLLTARPFGQDLEKLATIAHNSAVTGIHTSVVAVSERVNFDELDRITLSGQGNRRFLKDAANAKKLVQREVQAATKVVARAVRLRIRLKPGVKLIKVLGSDRLDQLQSTRVKAAERSIDLRLSRNLGIQEDRGEDEEGIQIVIPAFHAGDSHVVLLDVVVPGTGPVADVTARYKDLVKLRNGVARANLTLGHDTRRVGPLEQNVLKNFIAFNLSQTLQQAGQALSAGNINKAQTLTREYHALLTEMQAAVSGFERDVDIQNDLEILGKYLTLLQRRDIPQGLMQDYIANSMQYSGSLKVLPRPETD